MHNRGMTPSTDPLQIYTGLPLIAQADLLLASHLDVHGDSVNRRPTEQ